LDQSPDAILTQPTAALTESRGDRPGRRTFTTRSATRSPNDVPVVPIDPIGPRRVVVVTRFERLDPSEGILVAQDIDSRCPALPPDCPSGNSCSGRSALRLASGRTGYPRVPERRRPRQRSRTDRDSACNHQGVQPREEQADAPHETIISRAGARTPISCCAGKSQIPAIFIELGLDRLQLVQCPVEPHHA
jgi:hypothetical protein